MNLNTSGQVLFRKIPPQEAARPTSGAVFVQAQSLLRHVFVLFDVTSTFLYRQTFHLQNIPSEFTKEFRKSPLYSFKLPMQMFVNFVDVCPDVFIKNIYKGHIFQRLHKVSC